MPNIKSLIKKELERQAQQISLIASENHAWPEVLSAAGSRLNDKYSEGYPGKRYYPGNDIIDQIETQAIDLAKRIFKVDHANVQALSGAQANLIVYSALLQPKDKILALQLDHGGHLSHGHQANWSSRLYNFQHYQVDPATGRLNMAEVEKIARRWKPKLIIAGFSAYSRDIDWKAFAKIAQNVGAYLLADISHTAGLIAAEQLNNPAPYADVIMTTTHKSLRGPRAAIIMCKRQLAEKIDKAVFPGFQGGPHNQAIAGIALCLTQAAKPAWRVYAKRVKANAQAMADQFKKLGYQIISAGTDNHLLVIDLTNKNISGKEAETILAKNNILISRSAIPNDPRPPYNPSGIRIGTLAITSRGFNIQAAASLAKLIDQAFKGDNVAAAINRLAKRYTL